MEGVEPPTPWSEATCSSPLSYTRLVLALRMVYAPPMERAGNEARTRDLDLGKVALYRLSYTRVRCKDTEKTVAGVALFVDSGMVGPRRGVGYREIRGGRCVTGKSSDRWPAPGGGVSWHDWRAHEHLGIARRLAQNFRGVWGWKSLTP